MGRMRTASVPFRRPGGSTSMKSTIEIPLAAAGLGTRRALTLHRYGTPGARPHVHLQAALHADELPGALALHHLVRLLDDADARGDIAGEVTLLPVANPIGLDQHLMAHHLGRFELAGGRNFNRHFPNHDEAAAARLDGRLGGDAAANAALVREALRACWEESADAAASEGDHLRRTLYGLGLGADVVLDLHCDSQAVMHVYTSTACWPDARDLTRQLGAQAVLLAEVSGGDPFDEAFSRPWIALAKRFGPQRPVPQGCLSATVELRGESDVRDDLAEADALNLFRFLQRRGAVAGDPGPLPDARCDPGPLEGVDMVRSAVAGVLSFIAEPGARIRAGEVVAHITDPLTGARAALASRTDGILFARVATRLARPGDIVCKVAGATPLADRTGNLLTD